MMNVSSLARGLVLSVTLGAAAPLIGCGGSVSSEPAASTVATSTRAPVAIASHGPVRLIGEALGDVPLSAAQRSQLEQLAAQAEARHADERAARGDLVDAFAAQVQAGAIDRAALQPKLATLTAALQKVQPADRAALEQLHAALGPDQRVAFVDALRSHIHGRFDAVRERHPLKQWAQDLQLTDEQCAQLKTALRARFAGEWRDARDGGPGFGGHAMHRNAKVLADAFERDRFVLDEVAPPLDVQKAVAEKTDHLLTMAEVVLPILTPAQRAVAAQKLRERVGAGTGDETLP